MLRFWFAGAFALIAPLVVLLPAAAGAARPAQAPSIIEIPLRIPLDGLFEMAEAQMPQQAGHWRDWHKRFGIKTKYRAWRGPLSFAMQGEVLIVQAHVRYWIKARKDVLGALKLYSSCGVNEAPRQAVIGVMVRLGWGADWTLRPEFQVLPTRFLDSCEMTIADIDVTPLIGKEFHKQLEGRMREALTTLAPSLTALHQQARRSWSALQEPVALGAGHWLLLNPEGVALSPLAGYGDSVQAHLVLMMTPGVVSGSEPISRRRPLPALRLFYPRSSGLSLRMTLDLDYAGLGTAIQQRLLDEPIDIAGYEAGIADVKLNGQGREIHVDARLDGDAAGTLTASANLVFVQAKQAFELQDLDYTYRPEDALLEAQARFLYGYVRKALEAAANQQLQQRMAQWRDRLTALFENILPQEVQLDLASLQLSQVQLDLKEQGVTLEGLATGHVTVAFR